VVNLQGDCCVEKLRWERVILGSALTVIRIARDVVETAHSGDDDQNRRRKRHEHTDNSNNGGVGTGIVIDSN
jgi:hypothetical protein